MNYHYHYTLESLHIFKSKPKLNDSDRSFPLNIVH